MLLGLGRRVLRTILQVFGFRGARKNPEFHKVFVLLGAKKSGILNALLLGLMRVDLTHSSLATRRTRGCVSTLLLFS